MEGSQADNGQDDWDHWLNTGFSRLVAEAHWRVDSGTLNTCQGHHSGHFLPQRAKFAHVTKEVDYWLGW